MTPTDSALLFADLKAAQARSQQIATAMGCDGVMTKYWYECVALTNGQGAMIVRLTGEFDATPGPSALEQLTPTEITALQSHATVQALLPVVLAPNFGSPAVSV
jgi:hypothetical protein